MTFADVQPGRRIRAGHILELQDMVGGFQDQLDAIPEAEDLVDMQADIDGLKDGTVPVPLAGIADALGAYEPLTDTIETADRAASRVFDVRAYGVVGNGTTDDTANLQACADACEAALGTFFVPMFMNCKITSQLDLRYIRSIDMRGTITVAHTTGVGVLIGHSSVSNQDMSIYINRVLYAGSQSNVAIRAVGLKNGKITIQRTPYLQLYADAADSTMTSIAYTDWYLGKVDKHELYGETGVSWINENRFHGGRITTLLISTVGGTYTHNHNKWYDNDFESAVITITDGSSNFIQGARFEGTTPVITFGSNTWRNRIVHTWASNPTAINPLGTITDSGIGNRVVTDAQQAATVVPMFRIDRASRLTDLSSELNGQAYILPGIQKLKLPVATFVIVADTGIFPLETVTPDRFTEGGTALQYLRFHSDQSVWRLKVIPYDVNRVPLDGTVANYISLVGGWSWIAGSPGYYSYSTNTGTGIGRIVPYHPDIKYMRLQLVANSSSAPFTYVEVQAFIEAPYGTQLVDFVRRQMARPLYQTGTTPPTKSLLYKGDSIGTDTGRLLVTHRVDTALTVAAIATDTTITVASATGMSGGDNIAILLDDDTTHFTTINGAPAGSVVTLTAAMPGAAAIGRDVITNRFLHIT